MYSITEKDFVHASNIEDLGDAIKRASHLGIDVITAGGSNFTALIRDDSEKIVRIVRVNLDVRVENIQVENWRSKSPTYCDILLIRALGQLEEEGLVVQYFNKILDCLPCKKEQK